MKLASMIQLLQAKPEATRKRIFYVSLVVSMFAITALWLVTSMNVTNSNVLAPSSNLSAPHIAGSSPFTQLQLLVDQIKVVLVRALKN